ncbi:MAG: hypothetical protein GQ527_05515 [Bacteroidales bacterium]|nr:hypothetical protein [Bacteroidales bacterium]
MKSTRLILILILSILLSSLNLKAQYKIGLIVVIDDSLMTHSNVGWTIITIFKNEYQLPFQLERYCYRMVDSIFSDSRKDMNLVHLEKNNWYEYQTKKESLSRKEFKIFREKWFNSILTKDSVEGLLVIENIDPHLVYGMNGEKIKTEKIAISTGKSSKKTGVYIKMQANLFWKSKPKKVKALSYGLIVEKLPMVGKEEKFSELQLMEFQKPLQETIKKQLLDISTNPDFREMTAILHRNAIIRKYNAQKD